jgi:hypothetical protein
MYVIHCYCIFRSDCSVSELRKPKKNTFIHLVHINAVRLVETYMDEPYSMAKVGPMIGSRSIAEDVKWWQCNAGLVPQSWPLQSSLLHSLVPRPHVILNILIADYLRLPYKC